MKKKILGAVLILGAIVFGASVIATIPSGDSSNMTFTVENGQATLTEYTGNDVKINVPADYNGSPVTTISAGAFDDENIERIYLPITVTTVETDAFINCGDQVHVVLELSDPLAPVPTDVANWGLGDFTARIREFYATGRADLFIEKGEVHECVNICHDIVSTLISRAGITRETYTTITYLKKSDYPDIEVPETATDISMVEGNECVFIWQDGTDVKIWFECDTLIMPDSMLRYFGFLGNIETINNVKYLNTTDTTDMSWMFMTTYLETINLSPLDVSNVTTMANMFDHSSVSEELILDWDIKNVVNLASMFLHAPLPATVDLSSFDFSHSPSVSRMMEFFDVETVYVKSQADKDYLINDATLDSSLNIIIGSPTA